MLHCVIFSSFGDFLNLVTYLLQLIYYYKHCAYVTILRDSCWYARWRNECVKCVSIYLHFSIEVMYLTIQIKTTVHLKMLQTV